jgi:hypothetical protein
MPQEPRERNEIIEEWMLTAYQDGGIERFDDLHIDRIDETWRAKPLWIEGGLEALRIAMRLRDRHRLPVEIELAFSLKSVVKKTGINFRTKEEFAEQFDWSPPSLYLSHEGTERKLDTQKAIEEGHISDDASVEELNLKLFGKPEGQRCIYMEFRRTEEVEFCRSVWLQG